MVESLKTLRGNRAAIAARKGVDQVFRILAGCCHEVRALKVSQAHPVAIGTLPPH